MTTYTESKAEGRIKYSYTDSKGVKLYNAMIETIWYDNSPRNPSIPVIVGYYGKDKKPTLAYGLTHEEAVKHIRSFGFEGNIKTL